jgi:hypothetical protein
MVNVMDLEYLWEELQHFSAIDWNGTPKHLIVEMDLKEVVPLFIEISNQPFTACRQLLYSVIRRNSWTAIQVQLSGFTRTR